jgi:signal transduction histidine kinase
LWFRVVAIVAVTGALGGLYVLRERTLRRQRHELELLVDQRTQALKGALTTRDIFLRTVAHDLKAPMVSLRWKAQILGELVRGADSEPASLVEASDAIAAAAAEVVDSIDELRDLTRIAAGEELPLRYEVLDLVALCRNRVNVRLQTVRHPIQFQSTLPRLMIRADRARLGRVLDNLLDNATKFSPPSASIEVCLGRAMQADREWAVLEVRDHGIGIPAADLPHVFEQYHRGANAGSVMGEGLGLASARHLVLLHSGTIDVESHEGSGSTFTVRLPIEPAE